MHLCAGTGLTCLLGSDCRCLNADLLSSVLFYVGTRGKPLKTTTMEEMRVPNFINSLWRYLRENYPERADDMEFIYARGRLAKERFRELYDAGNDYATAYDKAVEILLEGYAFSKIEFIEEILMTDFAAFVDSSSVASLSQDILVAIEPIFDKYELTDSMTDRAYNAHLKRDICHAIGKIAIKR